MKRNNHRLRGAGAGSTNGDSLLRSLAAVRYSAGGLFGLFEDSEDLLLEEGYVLSDGEPHFLNINAKIPVDQFVAHPRDVVPGHLGVLASQWHREAFRGFS